MAQKGAEAGVTDDGHPFEHQEQGAQNQELEGDVAVWRNELRQERREDQDRLGIAGGEQELLPAQAPEPHRGGGHALVATLGAPQLVGQPE